VNTRTETWAWLAQRASAAVLALCVVVHLATMIFAVRCGLSAAEILGRTRGSVAWAAFYGLFVIAVSIHAPLGLRTIASEWLAWRGRGADAACAVIALAIFALGLLAVTSVTL
jgi:fumarate reductase subunit C